MNQYTGLAIALSFGLGVVWFEKWFIKNRSNKIKQQANEVLPAHGFTLAKDNYSDYECILRGYAISLDYLPKRKL